jgi:hypothetical protein
MRSYVMLSGLMLGLFACTKADDTDTNETDTNTDTDTSDTDTSADGFSVSGNAIDLASQSPAASGLCVDVADPTAALGGGEIDILASSTVGAGGAYAVAGVTTTSSVGLFVIVHDCGAEGTVIPSATGIAAADYQSLGDGDAITGKTAYSVSATMAAGVDASLAALGHAGKIEEEGAMFGFVRGSDGTTPIGGATVSATGATVFYADALTDAANGGLFASTAGVNTKTDATAGAMVVIPAAPIATYKADDGGAHTFGTLLAGSQVGLITFVAWYAE